MNILPAIRHPHEQNDCVDSSTASKSDWLNSLHRGCLNNGTSDKFRLYSHLRALPSRKLPHPLASDEVSKKRKSRVETGVQPSSYNQSTPVDCAAESEAELSNASLSPVFREDSTRPPVASEEVTPELFTVDEFFDYIWSDNWREEICLRVVGGKLLNLLLTALYHLEKKQKLNSHIIRANLNNRRKVVAKEGVALKDEQLGLLSLTPSVRLRKGRSSSIRQRKINQNTKKSRETKDVNKSANISTLPTVIISKPSSESVQVGEDRNYRGGVTPVPDALSKREHTSYRDVAALPTIIISKPSGESVQVGEDRNYRSGVNSAHDSLSKREHTSYRDVDALPKVIISKQHSYEYVQVGEDRNYRGDVNSVHDSLSKREHTSYRDLVTTQEEGSYESMVIQLIFYEKADKSNITYQIPDKANSNRQIPGPRHVLYPAYSRAKHNMKYVRLPISEDVDIKERIATLTSELDDMLKVTNNTLDGKTKDTSRLSVNIKDRFKLTKFASDTSRKSQKQLDRRDSEEVTDNVWFHSQPVTSTSSRRTILEEEKEDIVSASSSSNADHLDSLLSLSDDTDTSTYKMLNLSRKEIYITGLYAPRTENNVPVEVKLQRAKVSKHKVYPDNNPENSLGYKSNGDYYHSAHTSLSKESIHTQTTPYHSPKSRIPKTKEVTDENVSAQLWSQYIKEQEEMEMEMALNNNLTKNISERLYSSNRTSTSDNSTVRKKKAKRLNGKKVASGGDTTTQFASRQKGKRLDEESQFPRDTPSGRKQPDVEDLLDKMHVAMNVNSNSIVHLIRRKIVSKRYLYVHEFQEPSIRGPRPASEYQKRRSYQILNHTPYTISPVTDGDSGLQNPEKNYNHFGFFPKRIFPGNYKMHDGNWSHMGLYPHDVNDQVNNLSPREAGYQCPCEECQCLREALADLKPDTKCLPPDYLHRLGKLSRNFHCQDRQNYETPITVKQTEIVSHFVAMDIPQICNQLMRLIDNVMFRKEILTSSLGRTYITVTFSKERSSTN